MPKASLGRTSRPAVAVAEQFGSGEVLTCVAEAVAVEARDGRGAAALELRPEDVLRG